MKAQQVKELAARLLTFDPNHGIQGIDEFSRELAQIINSGQRVNFTVEDSRKIANDAWEFSEAMTEEGWKAALTKSIDEFGRRKWNEACDAYANSFFGALKHQFVNDDVMRANADVFQIISAIIKTQEQTPFPKPEYK